jgi:PRTRC genetic system protein E
MFKELSPLLRQRTVVMILTRLEDDTIRVNIIPRKLNESENDALTTPISVTGSAEELDAQLPSTLVQFVGAHLELKSSLESAKDQMAAAAKAAKAEARSKTATKIAPAKTEPVATEPVAVGTQKTGEGTPKTVASRKPAPARNTSLFDLGSTEPGPVPEPNDDSDEEEEIIADASENDPACEDDDLDDAA